MVMFPCDRLDRNISDFRLMRFKQPDPASKNTITIELETQHASFKDEIPYSALSYVWGAVDASTEAEILVNGIPFTVGHNLNLALQRLRHHAAQSWLWIDSICIDQSDEEEKTWSVAQMGKIFSQAECVFVWLGPGTESTDIAMDFASRIGPRAVAVGVLDLWTPNLLDSQLSEYVKLWPSLDDGQSFEESYSCVKELSDFFIDLLQIPALHNNVTKVTKGSITYFECIKQPNLVKGIEELMQRDYWHRIWVVQEISLAREATILCGARAISLELFDATFSAIAYCSRRRLRLFHAEFKGFGDGLSLNFYECIPLQTRRKYRDPCNLRMISLCSILVPSVAPPGRPHYSATDSRDIVFGLLGLIDEDAALGLRVDYKMTVAEVFTSLTRALLSEHSFRYELEYCVPRVDGDVSLPSWVPDWRLFGRRGLEVYTINHLRGKSNATRGIPALPYSRNSYEGGFGTLHRRGCRVDFITEAMEPPQWEEYDEWSASQIVDYKAWLASIREFAQLDLNPSPQEDYVWRTVMVGGYDGIRQHTAPKVKLIEEEERASIVRRVLRRVPIIPETLTEAQKAYITTVMTNVPRISVDENLGRQYDTIASRWCQSIGSCRRGRTLFKTANGMFGLGHVAIRPGDMVSLLWGSESPIVLRPRSDEVGGGFTFVGDAYVDGIMHGEFLKTDPVHEDFEIH